MPHKIFDLINRLEESNIHFSMSRHRDDCIMLTITCVGKRIEVSVFEDNHVEYSIFLGNEDVFSDEETLYKVLKESL